MARDRADFQGELGSFRIVADESVGWR